MAFMHVQENAGFIHQLKKISLPWDGGNPSSHTLPPLIEVKENPSPQKTTKSSINRNN